MPSRQATLVNAVYRSLFKPVLRREQSVRRLRGHVDRFAPLTGGTPRHTLIEPVQTPGAPAERIVVPESDRLRHILYLPGGGFVVHSPRVHRALAARVCTESQATGVLLFYRLAPEHPFPAAVEDCVAAYRQLLESGVPAQAITVGGDSSGGCLALAMLLSLRDQGAPLPAAAFMLSPVTDLRDHREGSRSANGHSDSMLTMDRGVDLHDHYVEGRGELLDEPLVSPVRGDFTGLPPLLFHASKAEILLDDSLRAAERAREAGVRCEVDLFDGVPHVWHAVHFLPESKIAMQRIGSFVRRHTSIRQARVTTIS